MPKKQKQSKMIPGEEKPPGFSLADFMTVAAPRGSKKAPSSNNDSGDQFPELGQVSQAQPQSSLSRAAVASVWGGKTGEMVAGATVVSANVTTVVSANVTTVGEGVKPPGLPYTIGKTKKGSLPIRVENRNKGKKVTVIFNVSGNLKELLSELKHAAGSGGVVKDDTVEIQGDKLEFVEKFLKNKFKK